MSMAARNVDLERAERAIATRHHAVPADANAVVERAKWAETHVDEIEAGR
jgi:hypothetical protein